MEITTTGPIEGTITGMTMIVAVTTDLTAVVAADIIHAGMIIIKR